ncbi:MAG: phage terminase small subunit P27 family [Acidobacteriota bacterium]
MPATIHKLRGTYRKARHGPLEGAVPPVARIPRPPSSLGPTAAKEWRRVSKQLRKVQLLTESDFNALEAYCLTRARALEAEAVIATDGRTITTPQGARRHPELLTAERAWADCRKFEQAFAMTPAARRGMDLSTVPIGKKPNPFTDLDDKRDKRFFDSHQ